MDHIGGRRPGVTARLHCVDRIGRDKARETARSSGLRRPRPQGDLVAQHGTHACPHTEFVSSLPAAAPCLLLCHQKRIGFFDFAAERTGAEPAKIQKQPCATSTFY